MNRALLIAGIALSLAGCNRNSALGNDQEAEVDPAPKPAPMESAPAALANVDTAIIKPETMSEADVEALGGKAGRCVFRLTEVGKPTFLYQPGGEGAIKLNGKLIPMRSDGEGRFSSGELRVRLRLMEGSGNSGGLRRQEMIVVPPGAKDELGYHGYVVCAEGVTP